MNPSRILGFLMLVSLNLNASDFLIPGFGVASPAPADSSLIQKRKRELKVYNTVRISTEKPIIDGILDDACWKTGEWSGDFIQFIPEEGGVPSFPTEVKILYDDRSIFVAIRAYDDEPDKIQKYAGLRDDILGDMVGINFDSYHDHRTGFEFDLTAYGQKVDLILSNPMSWDVNWNPVWNGKTGFEDSAWVAEMEIPLNQLRYSNEEDQVWGMHVWRWIGRLSEESDWEYQTLTGPGMIYNFGELRGISGLEKSNRLEVMPYALGELKTFEKQAGNPFYENGRQWNGNMGLDVKLGISSNFTLDMTVNPDFGQVEADPSVMNLTAFETFYEEKRPFFLEAKNIFKYQFDDLNLFYSRRIGHSPSYNVTLGDSLYSLAPTRTTILSALKLSGKTSNGLSVGLLQSLTAPEHIRISNPEGIKSEIPAEPLTNYMVARLQKDYNEGTTMIGGILTSVNRFINDKNLEFLSRDAYTGGVDLLHQWKDKKYFVDARLVGSYIRGEPGSITLLQESSARYYQRPGASYLPYDTSGNHLGGFGGKARIGKGTGLWRYSTGINWYSPGLELNDFGYMQMADQVVQESEISYFVVQPVWIFRSFNMALEQFNSMNFDGKYLGSGAHLAFNSEFRNKWGSGLNFIVYSDELDTRILRGGPGMKVPRGFLGFGEFRTDHSKRVAAGLSFEFGQKAENSARNFSISPGLVLRPVNTLKIVVSANYGENMDRMQYVTRINNPYGPHYILGTINQKTLGITFRLDYNITPNLSLQYYGSPFVSKGNYSDFTQVVNPLAGKYMQRAAPYDNIIPSPDFNFHQFRSNFVAKWEYRPGSFLYLVWADDRTGLANPVGTGIMESMKQMWKLHPGNIFLVKFNYWFSI